MPRSASVRALDVLEGRVLRTRRPDYRAAVSVSQGGVRRTNADSSHRPQRDREAQEYIVVAPVRYGWPQRGRRLDEAYQIPYLWSGRVLLPITARGIVPTLGVVLR